MARTQYHIYVIELSKKVYTEHKKFREANPQYNGVLECLYVGMTSKSPKERFLQHIKGTSNNKGIDISSRIVKRYGLFLRPSLSAQYPLAYSREDALKLEKKLTLELRRKRYAVWSN